MLSLTSAAFTVAPWIQRCLPRHGTAKILRVLHSKIMPRLHIPLGTLGFVVALAGLVVDVRDGRTGTGTQTRTTASINRSLSRRLGTHSPPRWRWMIDSFFCLKESMAKCNEEVKVRQCLPRSTTLCAQFINHPWLMSSSQLSCLPHFSKQITPRRWCSMCFSRALEAD